MMRQGPTDCTLLCLAGADAPAELPRWLADNADPRFAETLVVQTQDWNGYALPPGVRHERVPQTEPMDFAAMRNAALALVRTPWAAFLDPDESFTRNGWDAVFGLLPGLAATDVVYFPVRVFRRFDVPLDQQMPVPAPGGGAWCPAARLLRVGAAKAIKRVHEKWVSERNGIAYCAGVALDHFTLAYRNGGGLKPHSYREETLKALDPYSTSAAVNDETRQQYFFLDRFEPDLDAGARRSAFPHLVVLAAAAPSPAELWRAADHRRVESVYQSRPVSLGAVELSNNFCNLACPMCDHATIPRLEGVWSEARIRAFFAGAGELDTIGLYAGEPTLIPTLPFFIDQAVARGIRVTVSTNATRAHLPAVRAALMKCWQIQVSADGATAETYATHRPRKREPGDFARFCANVESLAREHANLFLIFTYQQSNVHEVPEFVVLAARLGVRRVYYQRVNQPERRAPPAEFEAQFARAAEEGRRRGVVVEKCDTAAKIDAPASECGFLRDATAHVRNDGGLHPCCYRRESWGSVFDRDLGALWSQPRMVTLRRLLSQNIKPPRCTCTHLRGLSCERDPYDEAE